MYNVQYIHTHIKKLTKQQIHTMCLKSLQWTRKFKMIFKFFHTTFVFILLTIVTMTTKNINNK